MRVLTGEILLRGENLLSIEPSTLRRRVGMVFQQPNPFPKSIFDNVAYGARISGEFSRASIPDLVEHQPETSCTLGRGQR